MMSTLEGILEILNITKSSSSHKLNLLSELTCSERENDQLLEHFQPFSAYRQLSMGHILRKIKITDVRLHL